MAKRLSLRRPIWIGSVSVVILAAVVLARFSYIQAGGKHAVDVAIALALALYAIATGYLGWHMTLHPPGTPKQRRTYKTIFVGLSIAALALICWQSLRGAHSQESLLGSIEAIRTEHQKESDAYKQELKELRAAVDLKDKELTEFISETSSKTNKAIDSVRPVLKLPALTFTFPPATGETIPVRRIRVKLNEGSVSVPFAVKNTSDTAAINPQAWIYICRDCRFVRTPERFRQVAGMPDTVRTTSYRTINPGVTNVLRTAEIIPPKNLTLFAIGFRYTCENCRQLSETQTLAVEIDH